MPLRLMLIDLTCSAQNTNLLQISHLCIIIKDQKIFGANYIESVY